MTLPAARHLVVGAGQVGTALCEVLGARHDCDLRDVEPHDGDYDVLHVAFGWSDSFEGQVKGYAAEHGAGMVVVHSTVPVGICDVHGWVHSPVTGRHPRLVESLRAFPKHFGGAGSPRAARAFEAAGVRAVVHPRARDTEAGKLWQLVRFGVEVRVCQAVHDWCEASDVDPEVAYDAMGWSYNAGYQVLGETRFRLPVLDHVPGDIGGHCVTQCSGLLDHWLSDLVATGRPETKAGSQL